MALPRAWIFGGLSIIAVGLIGFAGYQYQRAESAKLVAGINKDDLARERDQYGIDRAKFELVLKELRQENDRLREVQLQANLAVARSEERERGLRDMAATSDRRLKELINANEDAARWAAVLVPHAALDGLRESIEEARNHSGAGTDKVPVPRNPASNVSAMPAEPNPIF